MNKDEVERFPIGSQVRVLYIMDLPELEDAIGRVIAQNEVPGFLTVRVEPKRRYRRRIDLKFSPRELTRI